MCWEGCRGQRVGDVSAAALWRTQAERTGPRGPLPAPPLPKEEDGCAPRAGPPTEADKDLRADAERRKTE